MDYKDMKNLAKGAGLKFPGNISFEKLHDLLVKAELLPLPDAQSDGENTPQGPGQGGTPATGEPNAPTPPEDNPANDDQAPAQDKPVEGQKAPEAKTEPVVIVTGPKKGRWRLKRHFTKTPVTIVMADLSEDDLAALQADPKLHVEIRDAK